VDLMVMCLLGLQSQLDLIFLVIIHKARIFQISTEIEHINCNGVYFETNPGRVIFTNQSIL